MKNLKKENQWKKVKRRQEGLRSVRWKWIWKGKKNENEYEVLKRIENLKRENHRIEKNTFKDISFLREDLGRKKWKIEKENVKTTWQNRKNKIIERDEEEEEEIKRKTVLKTF